MKIRNLLILSSLILTTGLFTGCVNNTPVEHEHVHSYVQKNTDAKYLAHAADCEHAATYYYSCECGEAWTETFAYGSPLGHSFTNYVSNHDATCEHDGTETAHCDHVGCDKTDTKTETHTKLEHNLVSEIDNKYLCTAPTCDNNAVYFKHCADCGEIVDETFTVPHTALGHEYNPITGHCIHDGCTESAAIKYTVDVEDGSFKYVEFQNMAMPRDQKNIFEISIVGNDDASLIVQLANPSSSIYKSNIISNFYTSTGEELEYTVINQFGVLFVIEHNFVPGEKLYAHFTTKANDYENVHLGVTSHQYTNLHFVETKKATCLNPSILKHIDFDESATIGKWISSDGKQEGLISQFYSGTAGTGHNFTHHPASKATPTSPALKEHWVCNNCGGYFLDPDKDEEVEYEDLYDNTIYGYVLGIELRVGRGVFVKVRVTVDKGETPIAECYNDYLTMNSSTQGFVVYEDGSEEGFVITGVEANNHVASFLVRGAEEDVMNAKNPKAFYIDLNQ